MVRREVQIKITLDTILHLLEWLKWKTDSSKCWQGWECKMIQPLYKTWAVLINLNNPHCMAKQSPRYFFQRSTHICSPKDLYLNIHSSFIHTSRKLERSQMSMDKQIVVYSHNGILFSNKKCWITNTHLRQETSYEILEEARIILTESSLVVARVWSGCGYWLQRAMRDLLGWWKFSISLFW